MEIEITKFSEYCTHSIDGCTKCELGYDICDRCACDDYDACDKDFD